MRSPEFAWVGHGTVIELDYHQDGRLTTDCAGLVSALSIDLDAVLITAKGQFARTHFSSTAVHRFNEPASR
jgi:hypothetical protein